MQPHGFPPTLDNTRSQQLKAWIYADEEMSTALAFAAQLELNDYYLAAGFVRNKVWDQLHGYAQPTPLNDIDLIYYDLEKNSCAEEKRVEQHLKKLAPHLPWSVKNQARMHLKHNDGVYTSSLDAMSYWVETATAIGVRFNTNQQLEIATPFGLDDLFELVLRPNPQRVKLKEFYQRVESKGWLTTWPKLKIIVQ